jgi:spore coat protein CotH
MPAYGFYRFAAAMLSGGLIAGLVAGATIDSKDFKPDDLFQITKVWTVDFVFTPEQWRGIAPRSANYSGVRLQGPEGARNGLSAAAGIEFDWTHANLSIDGRKFNDIAVRYKGNGTFRQAQSTGKISFKIDLNKYVKGQKLAKLDKLNLANNIADPGWMNEELAYRLFRDAGVPAPRTSYARVYVTVTGESAREYWGLYSLVEDVDDIFALDRFGTKKGVLLKPVTTSLFHYLGDDWAKYRQTYDPKDDMSEEQIRRVIDFCKLVTSGSDEEFAAKLADYVDIDEFARFLAVTVWITDLDSILDNGQNFYVWLNPATQKFFFIAWDQDHSFGQFGRGGSTSTRRNFTIFHPFSGNNPFLQRVFSVPAFQDSYMAKLAEFSKTIFLPERIIDQVNEIAPVIRPAIGEESAARLQWFDRLVSDDGGDAYTETIKSFVKARALSVADQLDGKSRGSTINSGFGGGFGGPRF